MDVSDVVDLARVILKDDGQTHRWSNAQMISFTDIAERWVLLIRPDLFLSGASFQAVSAPTALDDTLTVGAETQEAMAYRVAAAALIKDDADVSNANMAVLYQKQAKVLLNG